MPFSIAVWLCAPNFAKVSLAVASSFSATFLIVSFMVLSSMMAGAGDTAVSTTAAMKSFLASATSRLSSTRSSVACTPRGMSPISSRNRVPPCAASTLPQAPPLREPVKAPSTWPNISPASSSAGRPAQFTATKGDLGWWRARRLCACRACATTSLPQPVSPVMSTGRSAA